MSERVHKAAFEVFVSVLGKNRPKGTALPSWESYDGQMREAWDAAMTKALAVAEAAELIDAKSNVVAIDSAIAAKEAELADVEAVKPDA